MAMIAMIAEQKVVGPEHIENRAWLRLDRDLSGVGQQVLRLED